MATQIQIRRGTAAQWTAANTVLVSGELGYETDTGKLKIGNGSAAWNALAYHVGGIDTSAFTQILTATTATAIGTAAKVATASRDPIAGDLVRVVFTAGNSAAGMSLNINGSGAKAVRIKNTSTTALSSSTGAGGELFFHYDGTYFHQLGSMHTTDTTYTEIPSSEIAAGTASTARTISGRRSEEIVTKARTGMVTSATLTAHTGDTSNPHGVTKAQIGLANVDNTTDAAKPVSTATQTALDGKATTAQMARVDPGTTGTTGQELRVTTAGPRWIAPDSYSPLMFGAVGDGVTNDYAAFAAMIAALPQGGKISLHGKKYRLNSTLTFPTNRNWMIDGSGVNESQLIFPDGIDGVVIESWGARLANFMICVDGVGTIRAAGTGNGLSIKGGAANLDFLHVRGFGNDGYYIPSPNAAPGVNANLGNMINCHADFNGRHGMHFTGTDANAWTVIKPNVIGNRGYGIFNASLYHNTFITAHAYGNLEGEFFDSSWSAMWLNPYAENEGDFDIGADSAYGTIIMGGHGTPKINYRANGTGTKYLYNSMLGTAGTSTGLGNIHGRNWHIVRAGRLLTPFQQHIGLSNTAFGINVEKYAAGQVEFAIEGDGLIAMSRPGGVKQLAFWTNQLGFFDTAGTTKPTVTGSRGGNAALASLLTALANLGLITNSTS